MNTKPEKRAEVAAVFARYERERRGFPTVRAIGEELGLSSSSTIHAHIAHLVRDGVLEVVPGTAQRFRDTRYRLVEPPAVPTPCAMCAAR